MCNIKIKRNKLSSQVPTYGTDFSAGADLYCAEERSIIINPHTSQFIDTGIAVEIPVGYVGLVFARSGLSCKQNLRLANSVGVIDSDYRDSIKVALYNDGDISRQIECGERIAQIIIMPYLKCSFIETSDLSKTERGASGFGGTGRF